MRAAGITALGQPVEIFEVDELAMPAAGEVLIDVVAAGIGNWDDLVRIGSWRIGGPAPMALGTEAVGTVAAAGSGVAKLLEFAKAAFDAKEEACLHRDDGSVMHAVVRIGDSPVMMGDPTGPAARFGPMPSSIYLYVPDCDRVYQRALSAGGVSVMPVTDIPFNGERYGGVKDPVGNVWWIATHVKDVSLEECERRVEAAGGKWPPKN